MPVFENGDSLQSVRELLNATGNRKNEFNGGREPRPEDSSDYGWEVGSRWYWQRIEFICIDPDYPAVWQSIRGEGTYEVWLESHPGGTKEEFVEDMRLNPTPELQAMLDDAEADGGTLYYGWGIAEYGDPRMIPRRSQSPSVMTLAQPIRPSRHALLP